MADFYSALSALAPCCSEANKDGVSIVICCENKQCGCNKRKRCHKRRCKC